MTRYERVKCALAHKTPDRAPSAFLITHEGQKKYFGRLYEEYVTGDLRELHRAGILSYRSAIYYGIGNHVIPVDCPWWGWKDLPPEYKEPDAPGYMPKTIGYGSYEGFAEEIRKLKENTEAYVLVTIWGSHFEKANAARGIENFLADMAGEPEYAQELLDLIIRKNLVMLENIVNVPGIDGILLGSDWGSQRDLLMSPGMWRRMIRPGEEKEYRIIKEAGLDLWIHSCGDIRKIMPDLYEMGVDALNPVQPECMDIRELKERYGDRITFWGGISTQRTLPYGTPDDVRREVRAVTGCMGKDGGYVIAPSQEIQPDVPYENIRALIEAAQEEGT